MKKGRTLRFIVVFLSGFLATTTSVYASISPQQEWNISYVNGLMTHQYNSGFCVSPLSPTRPSEFNQLFRRNSSVQWCTKAVHVVSAVRVRKGDRVLHGRAHRTQSETEGSTPKSHKFTITGKLLSHIVFVSGTVFDFSRKLLTLQPTGVDVDIPGEGKDTFDLKFDYSAKGIGPLLFRGPWA